MKKDFERRFGVERVSVGSKEAGSGKRGFSRVRFGWQRRGGKVWRNVVHWVVFGMPGAISRYRVLGWKCGVSVWIVFSDNSEGARGVAGKRRIWRR